MQYTIYNIQYTIYNIQYTIYTIYNIQYTIYNIQYTHEAWCCQEMESCREVLKDNLVLEDVPQSPCCITLHSGFRPIYIQSLVLNKRDHR